MKLAVIVTEFPKTTETFIARDLMVFREAGVDLRIYHLTKWRADQILHDFAKPLAAHTRHVALGGAQARRAALRHLGAATQLAGTITRHQGRDGKIAAKSLAILPAALAIGDELREWGADHIHAEFAGHPATAAWIANHITGIPFSVSCRAHDIFRSQRLLAQKFAAASAVRTVSTFGRSFLAEKVEGVQARDIEVIHSSVDVSAITPRVKPRGAAFRILYVGSLQPRKGVDVLLNALAQFDRTGWSLDIAGDGPDRADLEAQARALGLTDRVNFMGQQGFDKVSGLYEGADLCVAPSTIGPNGRTEGIPNVMIEALAHARPAISTRVSGIPELIIHGKTGWLTEPGHVAGLTQAITAVFDDPDEAARRALAGRAHVEAEFDLRVNALRQLQMFGLIQSAQQKAA